MKTINEIIEEKALAYESGKMMRPDSEIEIDMFDDKIWLCDYSPSREGAECIEKLCNTEDINTNELIKLCDKHDWAYVI